MLTSDLQGSYIRLLRQLKGIKQSEAAKRLGITQQAYSKIECGKKLTDEKIKQIIIALDSSIEELEKMKNFLTPNSP